MLSLLDFLPYKRVLSLKNKTACLRHLYFLCIAVWGEGHSVIQTLSFPLAQILTAFTQEEVSLISVEIISRHLGSQPLKLPQLHDVFEVE